MLFFREVLSENGSPSSKRVAFFLVLCSFIIYIFINLFTGRKLDADLQNKLFDILLIGWAIIFGVNIADKWQAVQQTKITGTVEKTNS
jgi:hypothetical protein